MSIPELDLKKVNLQAAVGYLISLHDNEVDWNLLGIRVIGAIDALPIPEGTYEYGDAYMVGTETPYDMYIYTRPDGNVHTEGYWFPIGKFPMPGPQGPKGDGVETFTNLSLTHDIYSGDVYGSNNGQTYNGRSTIQYKDSTTGKTKSQDIYTTVFLPIVGSDYINIDGDAANSRFVVRLDDTALALDYIKITDKTRNNIIPIWYNGKINWEPVAINPTGNTIAYRDSSGDCAFNKVKVDRLATTAGEYDMPLQAAYYGGFSNGFTIEKTPTDTGTLTATLFGIICAYPNSGLKYNNQSYVRMDPTDIPDGTLNYIHIGSIEDGNGGYKATGKCLSINVSTRAWQVVDLDFGGSTRTTHNLTLTNSTGTTVYFSLTNNRPETYEGAPAGLWSALETSQIACSVNNAGTYSAGMITVEGDNFKVFYGNSEEVLMTQAEIAITDNMV